jgi:hypothetical protein
MLVKDAQGERIMRTMEHEMIGEVKGRTHPFVSVSRAMPLAGAIALAFSSERALSNAGDVITAMGP